MTLSTRKIGGIRFTRIGRLQISYCVVRRSAAVPHTTFLNSTVGVLFMASVVAAPFVIAACQRFVEGY